MTARSQLARIERSLSPQQAALHFYLPLLKARTPADFALLFHDAARVDPIDAQFRRVRESTASSMRGKPREEVRKAQRDAASEFYFVHSLIGRVNEHAAENWEAWSLRALLVATQSLQPDTLWLLVPDSPKDPRYQTSLTRVKTESQRCLTLYEDSLSIYAGTTEAVQRVSKTYAAGTPILFRGAREELDFGLQCIELLKDVCGTYTGADLAEPPSGVRTVADALVALWVDQARVDLHDVRSEREQTELILERWVEGLRSRSTRIGTADIM